MFSTEFDIGLAVIFGVLTVVFFAGKGGPILDLFAGKYQEKKRPKDKQRQYEKAVGFFLLELTILELVTIFTPNKAFMGILSAALTAVGMILLIIYIRNRIDR